MSQSARLVWSPETCQLSGQDVEYGMKAVRPRHVAHIRARVMRRLVRPPGMKEMVLESLYGRRSLRAAGPSGRYRAVAGKTFSGRRASLNQSEVTSMAHTVAGRAQAGGLAEFRTCSEITREIFGAVRLASEATEFHRGGVVGPLGSASAHSVGHALSPAWRAVA